MTRAVIFDVDGTLAETEEIHRKAFNTAFRGAGLPWHWDRDLYQELLAVTGGKERIRHFIEVHGAGDVPNGGLDAFIRGLHREKTAAYTEMVRHGELELRPGVRILIDTARQRGYRLAIATTTTPGNVDALLAAHAAGIESIVTPSIYTRNDNFEEAALVTDDLDSLEFAELESMFPPGDV